MLPDRRMSEDEVCPIRDELLGELYRADENRVFDLIANHVAHNADLGCFSHIAVHLRDAHEVQVCSRTMLHSNLYFRRGTCIALAMALLIPRHS